MNEIKEILNKWFKPRKNKAVIDIMFSEDVEGAVRELKLYINSHYIAKDKVKGLKSARAEVGYYDMNESRVQGYNNAVEHFNSKIDDLVEDK